MIDISVIVPIYNVEKYLEDCINSIINQTFKNFELILVDDGSTDRSGQICDKFAQIDNRIKVIHKQNTGQADSRNIAIKMCKGEYIIFVDSDDYIHNKLFEITYKEAKKYNSDLVVYDYIKIGENDNEIKKITNNYEVKKYNNINAINQLFGNKSGQFYLACTKLYKRNIFDNIEFPKNKIYEDELIMHEVLYISSNVIYIPIKLYYYRMRSDSTVSSSFNYKKLDYIEACYKSMRFFNKLNLDIKYQSQEKYVYYFFKYYNKSKVLIPDWKVKTRKIKIDFFKSMKILLFSPIFNKKEKISWIVFIIFPKIYELYFFRERKIKTNE